jgi:tetratricopeptide (TPR) repeat protein
MNPFNVLEITPDASMEDIKAAYHRLAKIWHPDRYIGAEKVEAEARFRELAEAFSQLKDPGKRVMLQNQLPRSESAPQAKDPETAKERSPEDWAAMAKAAFEEGQIDQARALIHYAIRMDDGMSQYHSLLAAILEKEGSDIRSTIKALEMAVKLAPRDVESHIRLAGHFQTLGMTARAQRHLQMAREIAPHHPKLREAPKKGAKGAKSQPEPAIKGKAPAPPESLVDQLKSVWGRLTGKG